ncbi:NF-kappa-B-repressing factor [Solenopsis invicta]|uniref:NF-kappa-B-repressing factor n=1 Tax=Solenopsis invicta TaxID=13686 RepID=UPI0001FE938D|nr:NF-kappa-B-repressing factor [Solenopsis invicta]XP_025986266.1 NF-kappa-B-repressing factor [Solenopsis invicta]
MDEDWDVEQHKVEYESDEHWELRRKFLLAHKDKFPEDMLVCLAQVFVNVELLGCRYPQETMDMVKELSQEVAAEYREKQKKKLKRTFVEASEAASSKVKGCTAKMSTVTEESIPNMPNHLPHTANLSESQPTIAQQSRKKRISKKKRLDANKLFPADTKEPISNIVSYNHQLCENPNTEENPANRLKTEENVSFKNLQDHPYKDFVLWERPGDNAQSILETSAAVSGMTLTCNYTVIPEEGWECSLNLVNSQVLSFSINSNKKVARKEAAIKALKKLQKCCYTVKVKQELGTNSDVTVTTEEIKSQDSLSDDTDWKGSNCIGNKLMKMMGWAGGGLGKSEQGIVEPMSAIVKTQINREGLGLKTNSKNSPKAQINEIKAKCKKLFKDLLQTDNYLRNEIMFLDFPKEDRMIIHQLARSMGLKSRSYGKDQRKLIVSRKVNIWNLVRELNSLGGVTDKYELVKPIDKKFISLPSIDI